MQFNPHLSFNGNCEEAFQQYQKIMGGEIVAMLTYKGTPAENMVAPEWGSKIMHAALKLDDGLLMGADAPPDRYQKPQGVGVGLEVKNADDADRIFKALGENGQVHMPIQETFWATRFGMVLDRFGVLWMVNCAKPM